MDSARWQRLRDLFERASQLPPAEREAWVAGECGDDAGLLAELRGMLRSAERDAQSGAHGADFLRPAQRSAPDAGPSTGDRVGDFVLGAPLASGGMGTVFEATQSEPRRTVAIKLLHAGPTSDSAVRRFRVEGDLLARLSHPGIAAVYGVGVHRTESGVELPYLAMERVKGARDLRRYCDEERLHRRQRIELFLQVLAAVQHGHQQGVVHRDLKPANLLVDREGRARVIDFGIARALGRDDGLAEVLGPDTELTAQGEILGTLGYMSPEQLAGDSTRIDTRSDVYALGVVLHELLVGRPPHDLSGLSLPALARVVIERPVAPPPELPADLGWVIAQALSNDRERRYASASEFAADLRRFLADQPVEAGAPSATYRLRKFVRRNRLPVALGGLAAAALLFGSLAALVSRERAVRARAELAVEHDQAVAEATKFASLFDVLRGMLVAVAPEADGREVRVADVLERASQGLATVDDPEVAGELQRVLGESYRSLSLRSEALAAFEDAHARLERVDGVHAGLLARVRAELAAVWTDAGRAEEALALVERALSEARATLAAAAPGGVDELGEPLDAALFALEAARAGALLRLGRPDEVLASASVLCAAAESALGPAADDTRALRHAWSEALRTADDSRTARGVQAATLAAVEAAHGARDPRTLEDRLALARIDEDLGRHAEAAAALEALMPEFAAAFGAQGTRTCVLQSELAEALLGLGRLEESYVLLVEAVPCLERGLGPGSAALMVARGNLSAVLEAQGDSVAALELRRAAWRAAERYFGADDPRALRHALSAAVLLEETRATEEALEVAQRVAQLRSEQAGADDDDALAALELMAKCYNDLRRYEEALEVSREVLGGRTRTLGPGHPLTLRAHNMLTTDLAYTEHFEEALAEGERLLALHRRALPPEDPARTVLLGNLALYAMQYRQPELAVEYAAEADRLVREHRADDDLACAQAALDLGTLLAKAGRRDDALPPLERAVELLARTPGSRPDLRGNAHGNLGVLLWHQGDLVAARDEIALAVGFHERSGDQASRSAYAKILDDLERALAQ